MGRSRKKNEKIILEKIRIVDIAAEGKCIAKVNEQVVFVEGAAPGDLVDVLVTDKRKNYMEGYVVHTHEYSAKRISPFCTHFGICGGCKWQHIPYEEQLFYKEKQVIDAIRRIGKVDILNQKPILPSEKTTFYRNKLEFTFGTKQWLTNEEMKEGKNMHENVLGFHAKGRFDRIVDIQTCYLQSELSNAIRNAIKKYALENEISFYDIYEQDGQLRNLIVRTANTGETMVLLIFKTWIEDEVIAMMKFISDNFPEITSLQYIINAKKNETFHDLEVHCYQGKPFITERMENLQFRVGAKSFYQTNSDQAYQLYKITRDFAQLTGKEVVYDLYTGTGTIANFVAHQAKQVIGIEYVEMAIEDAKVNSQINGIENTLFYAGDMKDVLNDEFMRLHARPDVIITDPPRAGMHADVVTMLLKLNPQRIVYVSCNPATQARDINMLAEQYTLTHLQPVDMFPQTHHVENVVCLERK